MVILPSGVVTEVEALGEAAHTAAGRCAEEKLRALRFPPFTGERTRIKVPFEL